MPSPISQDASAAVCPRRCCSASAPMTSANDSFSAPDCPPVVETSLGVDHPVGEFVGDDRERAGESGEHLAVAVAEDHALAVPEGVVVVDAVVDGGGEFAAAPAQAVARERVPQQVVRGAETVEGLVDGGVGGRRVVLASDETAGEALAVLGVGDRAVRARRGLGHEGAVGVDRQAQSAPRRGGPGGTGERSRRPWTDLSRGGRHPLGRAQRRRGPAGAREPPRGARACTDAAGVRGRRRCVRARRYARPS